MKYAAVRIEAATAMMAFFGPRRPGLTVGEAMTVTLEARNGAATVDTRICTVTFPTADYSGPPPACALTTTAAYDALKVVVGWSGATTGSLELDAMSLIR